MWENTAILIVRISVSLFAIRMAESASKQLDRKEREIGSEGAS